MLDDDLRIGSPRHARILADAIERAPDGADLGPTDTALAAKALRSFAGRWFRRAAVALAIVVPLAIGMPDVNGDGRVGLGDVVASARLALGA